MLQPDVSHINKICMDVGTEESSQKKGFKIYISNKQEVYDILKERIDFKNIKFEIIQNAVHNVAALKKRFPDIVKCLFSES